ncbi:hypothetical protein UPYG_G00069970 [Umbra pygmaea]|uniref:Uncharacterized protein n=1 Tax=Umbra pygmaea TaxID=75934 RepID=A0ABD0XBD2_UMBPY
MAGVISSIWTHVGHHIMGTSTCGPDEEPQGTAEEWQSHTTTDRRPLGSMSDSPCRSIHLKTDWRKRGVLTCLPPKMHIKQPDRLRGSPETPTTSSIKNYRRPERLYASYMS